MTFRSQDRAPIIDWIGQGSIPAYPPTGVARMCYCSTPNHFCVFNSSGTDLLGSGTTAGSRVVAGVEKCTYLDLYAMSNPPVNPISNRARMYYISANKFAVISSTGSALAGHLSGSTAKNVEIVEQLSIIDFQTMASVPNPPSGYCRMYYDGTSFHVIDSTGSSLL